MASCTNTSWGYRIAYPGGWQTNTGEIVPECSLFDPDAIAVERKKQILDGMAAALRLSGR